MDFALWTDEKAWDESVARIPRSPLLQSWAWGAFQQSLGRTVLRLGAGVPALQVITMPLPLRFAYDYLPRGPLSPECNWEDVKMFLRAHTPRAAFLRVDPAEGSAAQPKGSHRRPKTLQPHETLMLDLRKPEEDLLAAMHEKTRYNIRLAERKGVEVSTTTDIQELTEFFALLRETSKRDKITSHPQGYYQRMFETLVAQDMIQLWEARFEKQVIAANLVVSFGDTVTYLHGASSNQSRNVMAPHLLQWRQIQDAKARGFQWYDFWGIAPENFTKRHPWAGITRFKLGFGGLRVSYPAGFDLQLKPLHYQTFRLAKLLRKGM